MAQVVELPGGENGGEEIVICRQQAIQKAKAKGPQQQPHGRYMSGGGVVVR